MAIKDIKLGEVKKYYIKNYDTLYEILGICVRLVECDNNNSYMILYGYDKNGNMYANRRVILSNIQDIKSVRLSADDKTREMFTKLYENYTRTEKYEEQRKQYQEKLRELEIKIRGQSDNLNKSLQTIMKKNGIMSLQEFSDTVKGLLPDSLLKKREYDFSDKWEVRLYEGRLIISRERQVDRIQMEDAIAMGIAYREYDDNVFMYSYDEVKDNTYIKKYVEKSKLSYNIKNLKANTFVDFTLGDKGHLFCEYGVDIKLTKPFSKDYAKEIVKELFKK